MEEIKNIKKTMLKHLEHKGGENFKSLNPRDLDLLFELYDKNIFDRQLSKQIGMCKYSHVNFKLDKRSEYPAAFLIANEELMIDISPNVLNKMVRNQIFKSRLSALQAIMEGCIVHLMILLWDYRKINKKHGGKLHKCVYETYFGKSLIDKTFIDVVVHKDFNPRIQKCTGESPSPPMMSYANWENSCYLDSILTILLQVPRLRNLIFTSSPSKPEGQLLKETMIEDYKNMRSSKQEGEPFCTIIRKMLSKLIPELREGKSWVPYSASSTYGHIADLIPELKSIVPYVIHTNGVKGNVDTETIASLQMWDYIEPPSEEEVHKEILFNEINSPVLVFTNGGLPRIKEFNKKGIEKVINYIDGEEYEMDVEKARKFSETIISKRYELVGVVTLHGVEESGEGVHYTCYFKNEKGWHYYNDVGPIIRREEELPEDGVWIEEYGKMPSMYFYVLKN